MALLGCNEKAQRVSDKIRIIPWSSFLSDLWEKKVI
jgi:hypothetical protein